MRRIEFLFIALCTVCGAALFGQSATNIQQALSVNADGAAPAASAMLDMQSTTQGMLVPRMTGAQRVAIASPATGLLVFDTDANGFWFYSGAAWTNLNSGIPSTLADADQDTKIQVEKYPNENAIHFDLAGTEAMALSKNTGGQPRLEFPGSNVAVGLGALLSNTTGGDNTAYGYHALSSNTEGYHNTATGYQALSSNTEGGQNTATGYGALSSNIAGDLNTASGYLALHFNTEGSLNTATGVQALSSNITGNQNTANGYLALIYNTAGSLNTATGVQALYSNIEGDQNTATGVQALYSNTIGWGNIANGAYALYSNTTGIGNAAGGAHALENNAAGNYNTAFGFGAFSNCNMGDYNTALGYYSDIDTCNRENTVVIGGNGNIALGGSNRVRIGNSSMSSIGGQVAWSSLSDERIKTNVKDNVVGLDFIMKLHPVTYNYSVSRSYEIQRQTDTTDWKGKYDIEAMQFSGFLAQEVEKAAKETGYDFSGVDKPDSEEGFWGLRYAEFTVPLVKAVQEQQAVISQLQAENAALKAQIQAEKAANVEQFSRIAAALQGAGIAVEK